MAASLFAHADSDDPEDHLESGKLYRVRMDGKLPCEYLQVTLADDPDDEYRLGRKRLVKALLLASDKKTVLQRITLGGFNGCTAEQGDFNFDGYRDFRSFLWQESGTGGRRFVHFVFDPKTHRYISCAQLDDLFSPYPDYQKILVWTYSRGGGMYSNCRTYRWRDGHLEPVSEVWRSGDERGWFTEYSTYENGIKKRSRRVYLHD